MRVLCSYGLPGLCGGGLQGERDVHTREGFSFGETHASLAGGQPSEQFKMRRLQEKLCHVRMSLRVSLRVVWHDGKYFYARKYMKQNPNMAHSSQCAG